MSLYYSIINKIVSDERKFSFSPIPARGSGSLVISSIKLGDPPSGANVGIAEMSFDVSIQIQAIDGVPVYGVRNCATPPEATYSPDPEYSKEARKAKYQGTNLLWLIVGPDGRPRNIKVIRSLAMGLDEQAIKAVSKWRFKPATKDGKPVPVFIEVEFKFRLQ